MVLLCSLLCFPYGSVDICMHCSEVRPEHCTDFCWLLVYYFSHIFQHSNYNFWLLLVTRAELWVCWYLQDIILNYFYTFTDTLHSSSVAFLCTLVSSCLSIFSYLFIVLINNLYSVTSLHCGMQYIIYVIY